MDHILRAGRHLLDLIDEVLDIARIESGYLELTLAPVAVRRDRVGGARADQPHRGARRGGDPVLGGPPRRVRRHRRPAAADAGPAQPVVQRREVQQARRARRRDLRARAGRVASVWPWRTPGAASASEDLDRVFVPFDRLGLEQTGIEGTGVGLALSQHLCERMGGQLAVESVAEVGSTFVVELPTSEPATVPLGGPAATRRDRRRPRSAVGSASRGHRRSARPGCGDRGRAAGAGATGPRVGARRGRCRCMAAPAARSAGRGARPASRRRRCRATSDGTRPGRRRRRVAGPGRAFRVLLVENNLTTLDLVERVLSRRPGTEVLAAMQGGLGVDLAREHVPDMILLDLYLPDMTGNDGPGPPGRGPGHRRASRWPSSEPTPRAAGAPAARPRVSSGSWPSPSTCGGSCRSSTRCARHGEPEHDRRRCGPRPPGQMARSRPSQ